VTALTRTRGLMSPTKPKLTHHSHVFTVVPEAVKVSHVEFRTKHIQKWHVCLSRLPIIPDQCGPSYRSHSRGSDGPSVSLRSQLARRAASAVHRMRSSGMARCSRLRPAWPGAAPPFSPLVARSPLLAERVRVELGLAVAPRVQRLLRQRSATPAHRHLTPLIIPLVLVTAFEIVLTW